MDLLLISIEAINLYNLDIYCTKMDYNIQNFISLEELFHIRSGNFIRHPHINKIYTFETSIVLIYKIHKLVNNHTIKNNIHNIFTDIYNQNKSHIIKQYLKRFRYIYYKTQNYYNNRSEMYCNDQYIDETAIVNLYIIHNIIYRDGVYFFIKYLKL
uniref:Uncharacterized protein n=1 Tax=Gracilariopsis mclachlanii TaxID=486813 RepID=A0A345UAE6_9FLOR|nr:hypothetical protein [Gracilariopsis mclachlanii]AXI97432.1 hypothetical protein [Gracilariopsis mclachlanii]